MAEAEIEEHVHHAKNPFDKLVAGTMASIAALLAIVSVSGQHFNTEKLLNQQKSSDQWAFYQAKNIRHYVAVSTQDLLTQQKADEKTIAKYTGDAAKYEKDMESIQEKANDLQKESDEAGKRADSFHEGEVFLEIGIVLSSLCILTGRKPFFWGGGISAVIGILFAIKAYL